MKCFCCGEEIVELPDEERSPSVHLPAYVREVYGLQVCGFVGDGTDRCAVVCRSCFRRDPDVVDCTETWTKRCPVVPFDKLPFFNHDDPLRRKPSHYEEFAP